MHTDLSMDEPWQIMEQEPIPEGILVVEDASLYIENEEKCNMLRYNQKC